MSDARIQAQRLELKQRYRRKQKIIPQLVGLRVRDLNRLLTARYGGELLPNDDAGRDDVMIVAHHLAQYADGHPGRRITSWVKLRAPWLSIGELEALILEAITKPKRWRADKLAWRMRLTAADRKALHITTIGAIDLPKGQRSKERSRQARARAQHHRRSKGAKPRAQYLEAIRSSKPWIAAGMSRATWFRRKRKPPVRL